VIVAFTVSANSTLVAVNVAVFAGSAPVTINVLANDHDSAPGALTLASVTQPASGGTASIVSGQVVFTPRGTLAATATFTYTVTHGVNSATATVTVSPLPPAGAYSALLFAADGTAWASLHVTTNSAGNGTGSLRTGNTAVSFTVSLTQKTYYLAVNNNYGLLPYDIELTTGPLDGNGQPTLQVNHTNSAYGPPVSGALQRSPYDGSHAAPQAGRYTGAAVLPSGGSGPAVACTLAVVIAPSGSVTVTGRFADGTAMSLGGGLNLNGTTGEFPFLLLDTVGGYTTRFYGSLNFPGGSPAKVAGTLTWITPVGVLGRLQAGLDQDYNVIGGAYTAPSSGTGLALGPTKKLTLAITLSGGPLDFTESVTGNTLVPSQIFINPVNGGFTGFYGGDTYYGIMLQGSGLNYGIGVLSDSSVFGHVTLTPQ
jgi:hypothetical protein